MAARNTTAYATDTDGAVTITIAAGDDRAWTIDWVSFSTNAASATLTVTLTIGSTVLWKVYHTIAGPVSVTFPGGIARGVKNEAVTLALAGGGGTDTVTLSCGYH